MPYTPILATLAYVFSPGGDRVLMVHRNRRPDDAHLGKYNGLGGKLEPQESPVTCIRRELKEEAHIEPLDLRLVGTINWPGFGKQGEDWFGFLFRVDLFRGEVPAANDEGTLEWIPVDKVSTLPLWEGDRHFLPLVFADEPHQFHGIMPYSDGKPVGWSFEWLARPRPC